ncbi:NADH dehydrogenase [ubiquinone] 1 beta subcomplex subunit 8, mitochondrial [Bufo bufo]|uniref:NADH dehydrogenase [ubiquinone] 1 beta subcomplex subunit 8, mitochondrial n=1 Tax=Bufo bufo TaxID=8384 RepID=UPI001ABEE536|nr:NADH dehydrogenase [ubiquinone] 1 beta subcomplex subunit 8, mitochondrial [Bufo bufo]
MAALRAGLLAAVTRRAALASLAGRAAGAGRVLQCSSVRAASDLPKDLLPGRYPKTEAERAAAAKKYNMLLEDYKPYPDDGMGYGDYPMLPDKSQEERDPWYKWDYAVSRRNWGEVMHWDFDKFIRVRVDTSPTPAPFSSMCKVLAVFLGTMFVLFYIGQVFPSYSPVAPKQYPYNNLYLEYGGDPDKKPPEEKNFTFK